MADILQFLFQGAHSFIGAALQTLADVSPIRAFESALVRLLHNAERFGRSKPGQDSGQAARQQRFARARWPDHQQIVAPRRGNLQRALGALLAFDLL
jgi:hypothetical protein